MNNFHITSILVASHLRVYKKEYFYEAENRDSRLTKSDESEENNVTWAFRQGQVQWCADRMLSLETDRTIFNVETGVCEILRSRFALGDVWGNSWNAVEELRFRPGKFASKFCLQLFTSSLEQKMSYLADYITYLYIINLLLIFIFKTNLNRKKNFSRYVHWKYNLQP